jgi:hypothetical protein
MVLLLVATARAQDVPEQVAPADTAQEGTPIGGVYVNDSAIALDKLALAQRLEALESCLRQCRTIRMCWGSTRRF